MSGKNGYVTDRATSVRMRQVGGKNTGPERIVRQHLTKLGYRYRLHRTDLPGCPDIVLPKHKKIIFVHGCFWHRHRSCRKCSMPARNIELWNQKFSMTIQRDRSNIRNLRRMGWDVLIVWECISSDEKKLALLIERFLRNRNDMSS